MTASTSGLPPADGWTTDDLDALPDDGVRRELLDGVLFVSPSPTDIHQIIAMRLGVALEDSCPSTMQVTQGRRSAGQSTPFLHPRRAGGNGRSARRRARFYAPYEVVLAVEILSLTSLAMDRITKPALYAKAGIPYYWRIETDGEISVHTYKIDPEDEVYLPSGTFTEKIETDEPWPISVPVARLTPRHF